MLVLAAALTLQVARPCPGAATAAESGWTALRRGSVAIAVRQFARADSLCPGFHSALVGSGFALLRAGDPEEAAQRFRRAVQSDSSDADAWYGYGLALARLSERAPAIAAWQRALRIAPHYAAGEQPLLTFGVDPGLGLPPVQRVLEPQIPARTAGDDFQVRTAAGWQPLYLSGINLGAALPGKFPSEFPSEDSTFAYWLRLMAEANANAVRLYTILPPAFYRALRRWNDAHAARPVWVSDAVWAELPPRDDDDDARWKEAVRTELRRVVDAVHGHARLPARPGHAFGRYDADVSDHVLGYILGREWEPSSIRAYNKRQHDRTAYAGRFLAVDRGTPADAWMAEQCDYLLQYEWSAYHAQRPIAYTNWPTLDPLHHPTEPTLEEEKQLRRRYGFPPNPRLKEYDNDGESLDAMLVRTTPENLAGYFAAYHAYPYYPDFIGLDSAYGAARSGIGPSHYFGYLRALKRHHAGRPLPIAAFGDPSSRGTSHLQPDGMGQRGPGERAMAGLDTRLARESREAGAAGGILFSWLDEWFKHTWVTIDLELLPERTRLWHSVVNAEQSYGLLGEYAGAAGVTPEPAGPPDRWRELTPSARTGRMALRRRAAPS